MSRRTPHNETANEFRERISSEGREHEYSELVSRYKLRGESAQGASLRAREDLAPLVSSSSSLTVESANDFGGKLGAFLVDASHFDSDGKLPYAQIVDWVLRSLYVNVSPEDAPCSEAWGYLMECRRDDKARQHFMTSVLPRFKQDEDTSSRFMDDGRHILEVIDALVTGRAGNG